LQSSAILLVHSRRSEVYITRPN